MLKVFENFGLVLEELKCKEFEMINQHNLYFRQNKQSLSMSLEKVNEDSGLLMESWR